MKYKGFRSSFVSRLSLRYRDVSTAHFSRFSSGDRVDLLSRSTIFYVLPWLLVTGESRTRLAHGWWVSPSQSIVGIIRGGKMFPQRAAVAAIGCCVV